MALLAAGEQRVGQAQGREVSVACSQHVRCGTHANLPVLRGGVVRAAHIASRRECLAPSQAVGLPHSTDPVAETFESVFLLACGRGRMIAS